MANDELDFGGTTLRRKPVTGFGFLRHALFGLVVAALSVGATATWFSTRGAKVPAPQPEVAVTPATPPTQTSAPATVAPVASAVPLLPQKPAQPAKEAKPEAGRQIALALRKIDIELMTRMRGDTFDAAFNKLIEGIAPYKSKSWRDCDPDESLVVATLYVRLIAISANQMTDEELQPYLVGAYAHAERYGMDKKLFDQWYSNVLSETRLTIANRNRPNQNKPK